MDFFSTNFYIPPMAMPVQQDSGGERGGGVFGRALVGLLRPLVRALIAQGVTAPALYRLLKRLYVEVAEADFRLDDARPTDSRISLLTGVHRRDVKAFRDADRSAEAAAEARVATIASVIGRWLARPETTDVDGRPAPLPRAAPDGAPSFESLVRAVSTDIRPRTVLDELLRQNLATMDPDGTVRLDPDAFAGPADLEQRVLFFAENVGDHLTAAVDNLLAEREPKFLERAVFYNRLTPASVDTLEAAARDRAQETLVALNRMANARQAEDVAAADGRERFRFGVYFYRETEAGTDADQATE